MNTAPAEINALLRLVDDPDMDVFSSVSNRIISIGKEIIPYLEHHWETNEDPVTQDRVETLIHRLQWQDLKSEFNDWLIHEEENLLKGLLLICKHKYQEYDFQKTIKELDKIKRNIWLELNQYLTPLEQVNVACSILFNYYKLKGNEINYAKPDEFLISRVIENKTGNPISNGLLILVLSQMLDINLRLIGIPRQFILACYDSSEHENLLFFLDGVTGQMYSRAEVDTYFKRIGVTPTRSYFIAKSNKEAILELLKEYKKCFSSEQSPLTLGELDELIELINAHPRK
jgi:regulator of sirC expression with transglutaminase-like and TPR domain